MDFEKFENADLEVQKESFEINEILKTIVETHKNKLKETKQKIQIKGESIQKEIDKDLFTQLIHNIIGNFIKYSGK